MSLKAYAPSVDATSSDGSSPARILQKMQSLTSGSIFLRGVGTHLRENQTAEPGRAGGLKAPVEIEARMAVDNDPLSSASSGGTPGPAERIDRLLRDLGQWAADSRAAEAAGARSRERWLRRQAAEEATASGIALDLAERQAAVVLRTTSGRAHQGRLAAVARDFWLLVPRASASSCESTGVTGVTLVATEAIASLRTQPADGAESLPEASGARGVPLAVSMAEVLTDLASDGPRVRIVVLGESEAIVGQLRSVGADVATIRMAGVPPTTVYVRLGSVTELSVLGSG
jgi:hypothetical protein